MRVLVVGGTRFFGVHLVNELLSRGHDVTIATRGKANDHFGNRVGRIFIERTDEDSLTEAFRDKYFDVVCDNLAYCSNDVKYLLEHIRCGRYVMTSSAAVYTRQHLCTAENEFDPLSHPLQWCDRKDHPYDEVKRQAECALFQAYHGIQSAAVRFPFVIGEDDYTRRLYTYVEHAVLKTPIFADNPNEQISFIRSDEAGKFLAWTAEQTFTGAINGNNTGTISLNEIFSHIEEMTGEKAIVVPKGTTAPFNGQMSFSLDITRSKDLGYAFTGIRPWIFELLDAYMQKAFLQP
ncbi:MAG TPA: NAD-dependent epimerase/dehydratase family protein [Clostridia bacterium]|nr:NAD-dependent epimerase/dehydratase family protein [Clostridia bacterium]